MEHAGLESSRLVDVGLVPKPGADPAIPALGAAAEAPRVPVWMWGVLLLFFVMHLLDYTDRALLTAGLPQIAKELDLTERQAGWLSTVFLVGLAGASLPMGYLADRLRRPRLLAMGCALWGTAAVGTGLAASYGQIQVASALVGVGSATFEVVALTVLLDLFPRTNRARVLAVFFVAAPMGAGALSVVGPLLQIQTWQTAFLVVGAPGLLLALMALILPDPVRGSTEGVEIQQLRLHERVGPSREDYIDLMVNSSYTYSVFGITFSTFALSGLLYWSPMFLTIAKGLPRADVEFRSLMADLGAGILGTIAGAWLAGLSVPSKPRALFVLPGLGMIAAIGFTLIAIYGRSSLSSFVGLFLAEAAMYMAVVPCFMIMANVVLPNMRGVAFGAAIAAIHLLGDIWSPSLMGWAADTFGQADSMASIFGEVLTMLGAVPVEEPGRDPENLTAAMFVVLPALVISGIVLLSGSRHLPREMALMLANLRALPSRLRSLSQPRPSRG